MAWDGKTIPQAIYRLRWELHDAQGEVLSYSAWTPNDQRSFSQEAKPAGSFVVIRGEKTSPYEELVLFRCSVEAVESIEYLVLQIRGETHHSAMGVVGKTAKQWVLINGEIYTEEKEK
jgi:hypothetical protein